MFQVCITYNFIHMSKIKLLAWLKRKVLQRLSIAIRTLPISCSKTYEPVTPPTHSTPQIIHFCDSISFSWIASGPSASGSVFSDIQFSNARRFRWFASLSSVVNWILYAFKCRSFVKIHWEAPYEKFNCCEPRRIDMLHLHTITYFYNIFTWSISTIIKNS